MQKKPIQSEGDDSDSWAEDQKERGYYYDDAHGYEQYEPEDEEDDPEETNDKCEV
jgi:hypothetical protein